MQITLLVPTPDRGLPSPPTTQKKQRYSDEPTHHDSAPTAKQPSQANKYQIGRLCNHSDTLKPYTIITIVQALSSDASMI